MSLETVNAPKKLCQKWFTLMTNHLDLTMYNSHKTNPIVIF